jgi:hypothetical protein
MYTTFDTIVRLTEKVIYQKGVLRFAKVRFLVWQGYRFIPRTCIRATQIFQILLAVIILLLVAP